MADDDNPSSKPPLHVDKSMTDDEEMVEDEAEGEFEDDDDDDDVDGDGDLESAEAEIGKEMRNSEIETLAVPSCYLRSEVPKEYTLLRHESAELKSKVRGSHQEALASVIAQAAQAQVQNQLQSPATPPPLSSAPSPNTQELRLVPVMNSSSLCGAVVNQQNASDHISVFSSPIVRKHATDGYNWRKYGQKQVKSPQGSRSYYRCTCAQCHAKKIECCDHSNLITEVIYKGEHNHGPPTKLNRGRESKAALSVTPISVISNKDQNMEALMDTDPSTSSNVVKQQDIPSLLELKRENSIDSDGDDIKEKENTDDPEPKRRAKKSSSPHSGSLPKTAKKPKLVVHTAGDMGISGDGYRWRKYGQKMVKGNPHPRNYYRCTSTGCPVRKHIERAVDRSTGLTITYKGVHDHEMPVAKKRHGTSNRLLAPAPVNNSQSPAPASVNNSHSPSPASVNNSQSMKKAEPLSNQESPVLRSVNTEGGLTGDALKVKGEKPVDSARTLLSVGFEIKPC